MDIGDFLPSASTIELLANGLQYLQLSYTLLAQGVAEPIGEVPLDDLRQAEIVLVDDRNNRDPGVGRGAQLERHLLPALAPGGLGATLRHVIPTTTTLTTPSYV